MRIVLRSGADPPRRERDYRGKVRNSPYTRSTHAWDSIANYAAESLFDLMTVRNYAVLTFAVGIAFAMGAVVNTALLRFLVHGFALPIFRSETGATLVRLLFFRIAVLSVKRGFPE
jgi:hypothetical protein